MCSACKLDMIRVVTTCTICMVAMVCTGVCVHKLVCRCLAVVPVADAIVLTVVRMVY
jgi:hypothetical protein